MFCKYCGNQYPDDGACTCPDAVAAQQQEYQFEQPQQAQQPAPGTIDMSAVSASVKEVGNSVKTVLSDVTHTEHPMVQGIILAIISLILNIIAWALPLNSVAGTIKSLSAGLVSKIPGMTGLIFGCGAMSYLVPFLYAGVALIIIQSINKQPVNIITCLSGVASALLLPSAMLLVTGLMFLMSVKLGVVCLLVTGMTGLVGIYKLLEKHIGYKTTYLCCLIMGAILAVLVCVVGVVIYNQFVGFVEDLVGSAMGGLGSSFDITDILGSLF